MTTPDNAWNPDAGIYSTAPTQTFDAVQSLAPRGEGMTDPNDGMIDVEVTYRVQVSREVVAEIAKEVIGYAMQEGLVSTTDQNGKRIMPGNTPDIAIFAHKVADKFLSRR